MKHKVIVQGEGVAMVERLSTMTARLACLAEAVELLLVEPTGQAPTTSMSDK